VLLYKYISKVLTSNRDLTDYHLAGSHLLPNDTSNSLEVLRANLYELKDELRSYNHLAPKLIEMCPKYLTQRFIKMKNQSIPMEQTLTLYLTNNGSEWLDSLHSGGLSFLEFRRLNVIQFTNAAKRWKSYNRDLENAAARWEQRQKSKEADDMTSNKLKDSHPSFKDFERNLDICEKHLNSLTEVLKITPLESEQS
jgi:hypothetical protein